MATIHVSFLLAGERFHGRLDRASTLPDLPAEATRVDRAGPGYKVIGVAGTDANKIAVQRSATTKAMLKRDPCEGTAAT
jgi:hypothetical protein